MDQQLLQMGIQKVKDQVVHQSVAEVCCDDLPHHGRGHQETDAWPHHVTVLQNADRQLANLIFTVHTESDTVVCPCLVPTCVTIGTLQIAYQQQVVCLLLFHL